MAVKARFWSTVAAVMLWATAPAWGIDFYVSADGNDGWSGLLPAANAARNDGPFATLERARSAIRASKESPAQSRGPSTVHLRGGVYFFAKPFELAAADSGTRDAPVTFRAFNNEEARLVGGRELPANAFLTVTNTAILDRIPAEARTQVRVADLKAVGITDLGEYPEAFREPPLVPELFFNGERMTLARWPNDDWTTVAKVVESGPAPWRDHKSDQPGTFEYEGDRPSRWLHAPGVWLHGYWCFDWSSETIRVGKIDPEQHRITLSRPHVYGLGGGNPAARRYFAVNLLEELDQPGEYYLDRQNGGLYFWPPQPLDRGRVVLSTLKSPVVALNGAAYITLRGLTVEMCSGNGIEVTGGRGVRIAACRVRNTGQAGIVVAGGQEHSVIACDIHDTGTMGLQIDGGNRRTLAASGHEAANNHIYRVSRRKRTGAYHIHVGGVGVHLAHNLLHDGPHQAIGLSGNDHVIEYNEIHHTGMETDDCGAFYMGRNPSERGTIIRYNFWHDIGSTLTHGSCAVYFDDGSGGQTVFGNVFYRAAGGQFGAVFVHGGHDNNVVNNLFVECKRAIGAAPWNDERWKDYVNAPLWQQVLLKDVDITRPPYIERYPALKGFMEPDGRPRMNHATRNVVVRCGDFIQGNWEAKDNFVTDVDPGFARAEGMDFRLRGDSVVYRKVPGFEKIPIDRVGLYRDEFRPDAGPSGPQAADRQQVQAQTDPGP